MNSKDFNKLADGLYLINHKVFNDQRGTFKIISNSDMLPFLIDEKFNSIQTNIVESKKNVFRGLHFQINDAAQSKIVTVLDGSITDYVKDLRSKSKTFLKLFKIEISNLSNFSIFISKGFAHGYFVKSNSSSVEYNIDHNYNKELERTINYNSTNINLPIDNPLCSDKDEEGLSLQEYLLNNKF